jgi:hypothetical protein
MAGRESSNIVKAEWPVARHTIRLISSRGSSAAADTLDMRLGIVAGRIWSSGLGYRFVISTTGGNLS